MASLIRQNYHEDCEALINKQINMELYASYVYLSMGHYYERDDVSLPGFVEFYKKSSDEERERAKKMMEYQHKRGGKIVLQDVQAPPMQEWGTALSSLEYALSLEKQVNESLLHMHGKASENSDPHLSNYLEEDFLEEQVESIKRVSDYIARLKRAGPAGLGEYVFDKELGSSGNGGS